MLAWLFGAAGVATEFPIWADLSGAVRGCLREIVRAGIEAVPKGQWKRRERWGLHAGQV